MRSAHQKSRSKVRGQKIQSQEESEQYRTAGWERTDRTVQRIEAGVRTQGIQNEGDSKDTVFASRGTMAFS